MSVTPVYLIDNTNYTIDSAGDIMSAPTERLVYAKIKSIKQSEFYQAQAQGFKVEKVIEVRAFEYNDQSKVRIDKTVYDIIRTYEPGDGKIEIILKRGVNNVST